MAASFSSSKESVVRLVRVRHPLIELISFPILALQLRIQSLGLFWECWLLAASRGVARDEGALRALPSSGLVS